MQMTKPRSMTSTVGAALAILAIMAVTLAVTPIAVGASSGTDYPIEVMRAHTVYQVADPTATLVGLGVPGNR